jgi:hydrogenase-4 membrane subunit HyfE
MGVYGQYYMGALIIATCWNGVLLAAIAFQNGWSRFVLAGFLICFSIAQCLLLPDAIAKHANFRDSGVPLVILLTASNLLAAVYLLASLDIRWLARPSQSIKR